MSALPRPRPRPNISPSNGSGSEVARLPRQLSPEARQRLSQLATERHKSGGFKKGVGKKGRRKPSRRRVAQMVAEAAQEKKVAKEIIQVFRDGIHPNQPITVRLKAAEAWVGIEREEGKLVLKEDSSESERIDREEALKILSEGLTHGHAAFALRRYLDSQIIEGEVVDDDG